MEERTAEGSRLTTSDPLAANSHMIQRRCYTFIPLSLKVSRRPDATRLTVSTHKRSLQSYRGRNTPLQIESTEHKTMSTVSLRCSSTALSKHDHDDSMPEHDIDQNINSTISEVSRYATKRH